MYDFKEPENPSTQGNMSVPFPKKRKSTHEETEETKERIDTRQSILNDPELQSQSSKAKPRLSIGLNTSAYTKPKENTMKLSNKIANKNIEDLGKQKRLFTSEDVFAGKSDTTPNVSNLHNASDSRNLNIYKKMGRNESVPTDGPLLELPKQAFNLENSPSQSGQYNPIDNNLEHSMNSDDQRAPHVVFQKRLAIPSLNLGGGNNSSYYTVGGTSLIPSPLKVDQGTKSFFDAGDSDPYQEGKKFNFGIQKTKKTNQQGAEQVSELELNEDADIT